MEPVTRITRMGSWAERDCPKRRIGVLGVAARLGAIGLFGALGLGGFAPATAGAQAAGQSISSTQVYDFGTGNYPCVYISGSAGTTGETCPATQVTGGTGTSTTTSSNATRTATASATLAQTGGPGPLLGVSNGTSTQASALTVTGTPSAGDQLVFHFLTSQSAMATGADGPASANANWQLYLKSGVSQAFAYQYAELDGTQNDTASENATPTGTGTTAGGFDLTLPFSVGSTFGYFFQAEAQASSFNSGLAHGATLTASLSAYLQGIDAQTANGMFISSASFDQSTGLGTISATSTTTTPEPSSLALLGTGVIGLIPVVRRRKS